MDLDFPILSLLIFLPLLGSVLTYLLGFSERAGKAIALAFSFVALALGTLLLLGFLLPGDFILPRDPGSPYAAEESFRWVESLGINYIVGVDELSVVRVGRAEMPLLRAPQGRRRRTRAPLRCGAFFLLME